MIVDSETGEVLVDRFAMMFFDDIEKLFSLTSMQKDLLMLMVKHMKIGNGNRIAMTAKRKKEFAAKLNVSGINSMSNALRAMEQADVIRKEDEDSYNFIVNPSIFFKGNDYQQAKVIIEYSHGERIVRVTSGKVTIQE